MGYVHEHYVRAAGDFITNLLLGRGKVTYSEFYNDQPGTKETVIVSVFGGRDHRGAEQAYMYLDWAATQLEGQHVVTIEYLDSKLMDGEHDYWIILTDEGRRFLEEGGTLKYWSFEV